MLEEMCAPVDFENAQFVMSLKPEEELLAAIPCERCAEQALAKTVAEEPGRERVTGTEFNARLMALDTDVDGELTLEEFQEWLLGCWDFGEKMFKHLDVNNKGVIDLNNLGDKDVEITLEDMTLPCSEE